MTLNDFTNRLGRDVKRIAPDGTETTFTIDTYKTAEYLHSLQDNGYKFRPVLTIIKSNEACLACEG